jgi:hypothetical protein
MKNEFMRKSERYYEVFAALISAAIIIALIIFFAGSINYFAREIVIAFIVAILHSGMSFGFKMLYQYIDEKRFMKQYNIQGDYYTEYQDYMGGTDVIIKERISIKQSGRKVSWISQFGDRAWNFEGKLTNDQLYGRYYAKSLIDRSSGNFLLLINADSTLLGIWMGYDSANRLVSQGTYLLKPIPHIIVRDYTNDAKASVLALLSIYYQIEHPGLQRFLDKPTECVVQIATIEETNSSLQGNSSIVGTILCAAYSPQTLPEYVKNLINENIPHLYEGREYCGYTLFSNKSRLP